jgi:hypothetical protein
VEPIATKDIALAVLSGSASIASILLVFIGFVIARAEALPAVTDDSIISKYTLPAKIGLIPLLAQVVVLAASYLWLYYPTCKPLFFIWSVGFGLGLVLFIGYSAYITLRL